MRTMTSVLRACTNFWASDHDLSYELCILLGFFPSDCTRFPTPTTADDSHLYDTAVNELSASPSFPILNQNWQAFPQFEVIPPAIILSNSQEIWVERTCSHKYALLAMYSWILRSTRNRNDCCLNGGQQKPASYSVNPCCRMERLLWRDTSSVLNVKPSSHSTDCREGQRVTEPWFCASKKVNIPDVSNEMTKFAKSAHWPSLPTKEDTDLH